MTDDAPLAQIGAMAKHYARTRGVQMSGEEVARATQAAVRVLTTPGPERLELLLSSRRWWDAPNDGPI